MNEYRFDSLTTSGETKSGVLSGIDRADIIRQLVNRGETATKVEQIRGRPRAARFEKKKSRRSMSRTETATLIRELATALEAGLPLMQALKTIRQQATPSTWHGQPKSYQLAYQR